ncbi:hypothetical protein D0C16_15890 [Cellvibrio sp. KY-GH-1]|uniref:hypothetical protein n=1 Tax=Cellvibrio sp. KY-GH-1 TaxID=2303332 RepID=UPI0012469BBD|nr:hypothetical protein [Cellvibrio sp. KY-GH-1]QEY17330.1 hypothetical protein D0C16_15890 [Cellvibrio sp. KY-GH-1]
MVSKKILGLAVAAAFSSQAFAAIDMTAGTNGAGTGAVTVAKESVTTAQVTSGLVQVTHATAFDTTFDLGFGTSAGSHAFIRIDLTGGAKFKTGVSGASLTLTGKVAGVANDYVVQVGQGGAAGDTYVIFDVTAVTAMTQGQDVVLDLADIQLSPTSGAGMTVAHYSTSPAAVSATASNTTGALATDSYNFASVTPALKVNISGSDKTADVNATPVFTQFTGATPTATLGNVQFVLTAGAITPAGTAVTLLSQLIDTSAGKSKLALTGDLSFIGKTDAATTATKLTFGGVAADVAGTASSIVSTGMLTDLSGQLVEDTTTDPLVGNNVVITANGSDAINAGSYTLTFTPTNIASAAYGAASASGSIGSILRNGATAQVPYLTTNAGLNQKLVLVNRGSNDTTYSITFTPEAGVTAAAGTKATGTLAKGKTLVLKAADVVTLTGGTRTAATIVALAPASVIDAATQTVVTDTTSVSYGSNDTVNLTVK